MNGPTPIYRCARAAIAMLLLVPALASADWHEPVGGASPINKSATRNGGNLDLRAIAGVPYVAWNEDTTVQGQGNSSTIHVSRLALDGLSWQRVADTGPNPLSVRTSSSSDDPSLADVGGTPWVAWDEGVSQTDKEIRVARLNVNGDAWVHVPSPAQDHPINITTDGNANQPNLVDAGGRPFVSFFEFDPGSGSFLGSALYGLPATAPAAVYVRRVNAAGDGWDTVGGGAVNPDTTADAAFARMTLVGGVPWLVFWQFVPSNSGPPTIDVDVAHLSDDGSSWVQLPAVTHAALGQNGPTIGFPSIATVGGKPYVAFSDLGAGSVKRATVYALNDAGNGWDLVGGGPASSNGVSADAMSIAAVSGAPWVSWSEQGNNGQVLRSARVVDGVWQQAGTTPTHTIGNREVAGPSLAAVNGIPWIGFAEDDGTVQGNPSCCAQERVSRLEPTLTGSNAQSSSTTASLLTSVQTFGLPYPVGFRYGAGNDRSSGTPLAAVTGDPAFSFQSISGLQPSTLYTYAAVATAGTPQPLVEGAVNAFVTQPATSAAQQGPAGAAGAAGANGAPGARGPAGRQGRIPLLAAILSRGGRVHARHALYVRIFLSRRAAVRLRLSHGGRSVRTVRRHLSAGVHTLRLRGPRRPGHYRLTLRATAAGRAVVDHQGLHAVR